MAKKPIDEARAILLQLAERTKALRAWKKKNSEVFEKSAKIEKEVAAATDELKKAVRGMAIPGETVKVFDDEVGKVIVVAGQSTPGYSIAVAAETWPRAAFDRVVAIDAKKVRAIVELGELDEDLAEKAELPKEDLTPRVTIEIR